MAISAWRRFSAPLYVYDLFGEKDVRVVIKGLKNTLILIKPVKPIDRAGTVCFLPSPSMPFRNFLSTLLTLVCVWKQHAHSWQTRTGDEKGNVWTHLVQLNVGITFSLSKKHVRNFKCQAGHCKVMPPYLHFLAPSHKQSSINCQQACLPQARL